MAQQIEEGGARRVLAKKKMQNLIEEEELSEDEIRKQVENNNYYKFLRDKKREDQVRSFHKRQQKIGEELENMLVDINQEKPALVKANTVVESRADSGA